MKVSEIKEIIHADKISKHKGIFTFRDGFFYTHGYDSDKYRTKIENTLIRCDIKFETIDDGEVWLPFKGNAPIEKQSHWFVKIRIID